MGKGFLQFYTKMNAAYVMDELKVHSNHQVADSSLLWNTWTGTLTRPYLFAPQHLHEGAVQRQAVVNIYNKRHDPDPDSDAISLGFCIIMKVARLLLPMSLFGVHIPYHHQHTTMSDGLAVHCLNMHDGQATPQSFNLPILQPSNWFIACL